LGAVTLTRQLQLGLGILGYNHPVMWAVYITNFIFWVGIGHAGTLISSILLLFRQRWRTSINRTAEAMTIFAIMCAGIFPIIHTGRPWVAFWLIPYPSERLLWVNFRSPLIWDVFAVSTYFTVSLLFWYQGLIPDFATIRDQSKNKIQKFIYTILSFGWTGSARDWNHYERAYHQFAWIAAPLVLSVHSIVSYDFAVSLLPGWHTTIFPPYFVAGAIFSGMGMVLTLTIIMRKVLNLEEYITMRHIDLMCKITLLTSLMVSYTYLFEIFTAWFSEESFEQNLFLARYTGPYAWATWTMITCNVFIPNLFWFKKIRQNIIMIFVISLCVNIGMWFERFVIIVTSLYHNFMPVTLNYYRPTVWDMTMTLGSFGLFFTLFLIFCRVFPTLAMAEIKGVLVKPAEEHSK
ncbi:MAG: polysulfide reductase NrfD, partial [Patescibacteria group bacterium]|nr:polysulfide reductase NrfD [Patescibacteria group bacterium]